MASFEISGFGDGRQTWLHRPDSWNVVDSSAGGDVEGSGGSFEIEGSQCEVLKIKPPAKKDFWARTFYSPLLIKSDASALLFSCPWDLEATIKTQVSFSGISQFDQAGLLVYIDDDNWMKCGLEYCDGSPRLSVVVTNNGFSDWSTQSWACFAVKLRVHKVLQSDSIVVEASPVPIADEIDKLSINQRASCDSLAVEVDEKDEYHFIRIAHLGSQSVMAAQGKRWRVGPYAACPITQRGCEATFTQFSVGAKEKTIHSAAL